MTFYVVLYDNYCITIPKIWINFTLFTFKMPKKSKQLTQACIKQSSPCDDWDEFTFHKSFGPYETYQNARAVEKAVGEISASDENINIEAQQIEDASSNKRFIKKRKFYGDTSSEDEPKKKTTKKVKMPSNYISHDCVSEVSQPHSKSLTITKPGLSFIYIQAAFT
ncbi:hypothetical protein ACS0PU_006558 [Formica fusca]